VTFLLAVATIFLLLTLPNRPKAEKRTKEVPEEMESGQIVLDGGAS
jgi:hypothetical protein